MGPKRRGALQLHTLSAHLLIANEGNHAPSPWLQGFGRSRWDRVIPLWLKRMRCPRWLEHCILWCGMKGIAPTSNFFLQPLKGVSDPPDRTAGPSRYFPIPASIACLSGCPVGRWAGHRRWTGARIGGSGYSLKALYINSSSSRERLFLWTSAFSSTLARTCVAAKYVGRRAQSAGLADNNFRAAAFCVDNCPVVPKMCPGLSTAA